MVFLPSQKERKATSHMTALFFLSGSSVKKGVPSMMDVILIGAATVFFALCFAYTRACDRL